MTVKKAILGSTDVTAAALIPLIVSVVKEKFGAHITGINQAVAPDGTVRLQIGIKTPLRRSSITLNF